MTTLKQREETTGRDVPVTGAAQGTTRWRRYLVVGLVTIVAAVTAVLLVWVVQSDDAAPGGEAAPQAPWSAGEMVIPTVRISTGIPAPQPPVPTPAVPWSPGEMYLPRLTPPWSAGEMLIPRVEPVSVQWSAGEMLIPVERLSTGDTQPAADAARCADEHCYYGEVTIPRSPQPAVQQPYVQQAGGPR
jgi:hypothetical protein